MRMIDLVPQEKSLIEQTAQLLHEGFRAHWPEAWPDLESARREVEESFHQDRLSRIAVDDNGRVLGWIGGIKMYDGRVWELHPPVVNPEVQAGYLHGEAGGEERKLVITYVILFFSKNAGTFFSACSSMVMPKTTSPCDEYCSCSFCSSGMLFTQGLHHVAQKSSSTTLPRKAHLPVRISQHHMRAVAVIHWPQREILRQRGRSSSVSMKRAENIHFVSKPLPRSGPPSPGQPLHVGATAVGRGFLGFSCVSCAQPMVYANVIKM